ncbi:MAG: ROK family protein [Hyphomonadaceae bacterium]|jgi:fructokinase|nr:ROK family protein [Hyphomonadaceae bacterium]
MAVYGGIDAGGTSFRCVAGTGPDAILAEVAFPTTTPGETLARAAAFFSDGPGAGATRIGIGCFGPVALSRADPAYGHILETPKPGWAGADVAGTLARATGKPVALDTDVNAAARGERRWGAGQGLDDVCYITVGTGIGAGIVTGGRTIQGVLHPEAGHIRVPRHPHDLDYPGCCPFHGDCVEGLASAAALFDRWKLPPDSLPDDHPAWDIEAHYLAHLAATLVLITATARVILGGGVMARAGLVEAVNIKTVSLLAGYGSSALRPQAPLVVAPGLRLRAGVLGALALAIETA